MIQHSTIEKTLSLIEGVSPIMRSDSTLFRIAFEQDVICYGNSWLYILRATRNDLGEPGYKFYKPGILLGMGVRKGRIYLTRPIGERRFENVLELSSRIFNLTGCLVILKQIDQKLAERLLETGQFQNNHSVYEQSIFEDEAFPERLVVLEKLFNTDSSLNPATRNLRKKIKRFQRNGLKLHAYWNHSRADLQTFQESIFSLSEFDRDKYSAYLPIVKEILSETSDQARYRICAFYQREKMHGFYIGEFLSKVEMGLYCALSSKAAPGITEWMDTYFLTHAWDEGIRLVYLGGSETEGVDEYVKKLLPEPPSSSTFPLVYAPSNNGLIPTWRSSASNSNE
jgi:hypothetical protein